MLSLLVALLIPSSYQAKTALLPPEHSSTLAFGPLPALSTIGIDFLRLKNSGALFIGILNSNTIENNLIDRFDLRRVYREDTYRGARQELSKHTDIEEDRKSGVITITITDHDPHRASVLARAYVEELNRRIADLDTSAAHRQRIFLEERLKVVKQELDQSATKFSVFSSTNTAIDIEQQANSMMAAATKVQGEVIAAQAELSELEQIFTPNHPYLLTVHARLAELQRQLAKLGGPASLGSSDSASRDQFYPPIRQLPLLGVTFADLYRALRINENVYEALSKEYELARVEEAEQVPIVKVIDIAQLPEKRSGPPRLLIILSGGVVSFCCAATWLLGRRAWLNADPQSAGKMLAEEVLMTMRQGTSWKRALTWDALEARIHLFGLRINHRHS